MSKVFDTQNFLKLQPICEGRFYYFDQLDSTSDYAKKLVTEGAESGTLVLAEHQLLGRGRGGNSWLSPACESLLFTLVVEPDVAPILWHRFSLITGIALISAMKGLCHSPPPLTLKWPNDLYLNGKKCAGILTEIIGNKLLVGIGINIAVKEFPPEISAKATSLLREGFKMEREPLLASIVTEIFKAGSLAGDNFEYIMSTYNDYCMLTGKRISFLSAEKQLEGIVSRIGADGTLIIDHGSETVHYHEAKDILLLE